MAEPFTVGEVAEVKELDEEGGVTQLADSLIRLACWQAQGKRPSQVEAGVEYVDRFLSFSEAEPERTALERMEADEWIRQHEEAGAVA